MSDRPPFCRTAGAVQAFERWKARVVALGAVLGEADAYVLGVAACREARLEELGRDLANCKDESRRLRLVAAERLAANDMCKALELLERTYGAAAPAVEVPLQATGTTGTTGRVVSFPRPAGLSVTAQRLVAAVRAHGPLTKAQLRAGVKGSQDDFLEGLKAAQASGAIVRTGAGSKARPFLYGGADGVVRWPSEGKGRGHPRASGRTSPKARRPMKGNRAARSGLRRTSSAAGARFGSAGGPRSWPDGSPIAPARVRGRGTNTTARPVRSG